MPNSTHCTKEAPDWYYAVKAQDWNCLNSFFEKRFKSKKQWVFRGQANAQWGLETTLERCVYQYCGVSQTAEEDKQKRNKLKQEALKKGLPNPVPGNENTDIRTIEGGLLREFKRHYHHFSKHIPEKNNYLEWFAIMRHYGAPVRLLDWTYSFFVALYFAVKDAQRNKCAAVWALNLSELEDQQFKRVLHNQGVDKETIKTWVDEKDITEFETLNKLIIRRKPISFVAAVNPYTLNERLIMQQGVFLVPGDVSKPFEDNLVEFDLEPPKDEPEKKSICIKIEINLKNKIDFRSDILERLTRMNITEATLFPGLDGFARSLGISSLVRPDLLTPDDEWSNSMKEGDSID